MPRIEIPIPLGFYKSASPAVSSQNCINWIPTVVEGESPSARALMQPSGLTLITNTGFGTCRGVIKSASKPYFVCGTSLVSVNENLSTTTHGTIPGTDRVIMATSGNQIDASNVIVIVTPDTGAGFVFDVDSNTITKINSANYQPSSSVVYYRGFYSFVALDGKQVFTSNLNQPLVYDALDTSTSDADPDGLVSQILDHDELTVLSENSSEVFVLSTGSATNFPFTRVSGAFTQKGVRSKYGIVKFDNTYLFIGGGDGELASIWRQSSGSSAVKISTDAIDNAIQKFSKAEISKAFCFSYSKRGQFLAVFTFNSETLPSRTFVYNGTASGLSGSSVWFEAQSGISANSWRVNAVTDAYGKLLVGDATSGNIGYLDDTVFTEYGQEVLRQATTRLFDADGVSIFSGELEATLDAGVGLTIGQGSDPTIRMSFSDDNGNTFTPEFSRSIGKIGEYGHETVWHRQGRFPRTRMMRFSITDPVEANLVRIAATPERGTD